MFARFRGLGIVFFLTNPMFARFRGLGIVFFLFARFSRARLFILAQIHLFPACRMFSPFWGRLQKMRFLRALSVIDNFVHAKSFKLLKLFAVIRGQTRCSPAFAASASCFSFAASASCFSSFLISARGGCAHPARAAYTRNRNSRGRCAINRLPCSALPPKSPPA